MLKKVIELGIVGLLGVAIIIMVFSVFNPGKKSAEGSISKILSVLNDASDYSNYADMTILGEELYALTNNEDGVEIKVITGEDGTGTVYKEGVNLTAADQADNRKNKVKKEYINPNKTFTCTEVTSDRNGVVSRLTFKQN